MPRPGCSKWPQQPSQSESESEEDEDESESESETEEENVRFGKKERPHNDRPNQIKKPDLTMYGRTPVRRPIIQPSTRQWDSSVYKPAHKFVGNRPDTIFREPKLGYVPSVRLEKEWHSLAQKPHPNVVSRTKPAARQHVAVSSPSRPTQKVRQGPVRVYNQSSNPRPVRQPGCPGKPDLSMYMPSTAMRKRLGLAKKVQKPKRIIYTGKTFRLAFKKAKLSWEPPTEPFPFDTAKYIRAYQRVAELFAVGSHLMLPLVKKGKQKAKPIVEVESKDNPEVTAKVKKWLTVKDPNISSKTKARCSATVEAWMGRSDHNPLVKRPIPGSEVENPTELPGSDDEYIVIRAGASGNAQMDKEKTTVGKEKAGIEKQKADVEKEKADVEKEKADVEKQKADVEKQKADVEKQKADVEKQKADVEKQKADVEKEKTDVEKEKTDVEILDVEVNDTDSWESFDDSESDTPLEHVVCSCAQQHVEYISHIHVPTWHVGNQVITMNTRAFEVGMPVHSHTPIFKNMNNWTLTKYEAEPPVSQGCDAPDEPNYVFKNCRNWIVVDCDHDDLQREKAMALAGGVKVEPKLVRNDASLQSNVMDLSRNVGAQMVGTGMVQYPAQFDCYNDRSRISPNTQRDAQNVMMCDFQRPLQYNRDTVLRYPMQQGKLQIVLEKVVRTVGTQYTVDQIQETVLENTNLQPPKPDSLFGNESNGNYRAMIERDQQNRGVNRDGGEREGNRNDRRERKMRGRGRQMQGVDHDEDGVAMQEYDRHDMPGGGRDSRGRSRQMQGVDTNEDGGEMPGNDRHDMPGGGRESRRRRRQMQGVDHDEDAGEMWGNDRHDLHGGGRDSRRRSRQMQGVDHDEDAGEMQGNDRHDLHGGGRNSRRRSRQMQGVDHDGGRRGYTCDHEEQGRDQQKHTGDREDQEGDRLKRAGDRDDQGGDRQKRGGDRDDQGGDRPKRGGNRDDQGGDRQKRSGDSDSDDQGGDRPKRAGDREEKGGGQQKRGGDRDDQKGDRQKRGGDRDDQGGDRQKRSGDRDDQGGDRQKRSGDRDDQRGDRQKRGGDREDQGGDQQKRGGDRDDQGGDQQKRGGDRDDQGGDRQKRGGDREDQGGDRQKRGGDRDDQKGDRQKRGGDRDDQGGDRQKRSGDRDDQGGDRQKRSGDRDDQRGDRQKRSGDRDDQGGDRQKRSGDRDDQKGDRQKRGGDREDQGGDQQKRGGDRDDQGGDQQKRGGDRDDQKGDRPKRGGDRDDQGGDQQKRGGDRDDQGGDQQKRGGDRDDQGGDRPKRGGDRDDQGGDRQKRGGDRDDQGGDRQKRGGDRDDQGGDRQKRGGDQEDHGGDREDQGGDHQKRAGDREDRHDRDQNKSDGLKYHGDQDKHGRARALLKSTKHGETPHSDAILNKSKQAAVKKDCEDMGPEKPHYPESLVHIDDQIDDSSSIDLSDSPSPSEFYNMSTEDETEINSLGCGPRSPRNTPEYTEYHSFGNTPYAAVFGYRSAQRPMQYPRVKSGSAPTAADISCYSRPHGVFLKRALDKRAPNRTLRYAPNRAPKRAPKKSSQPRANPVKDDGEPVLANENKKDKKKKAMVKNVELTIESHVGGYSTHEIDNCHEKECKMISGDRQEKERVDARNALEEYVYDLRGKLCSEDDLASFVPKAERTALCQELDNTEAWLYDEGEDCARNMYFERLTKLKSSDEDDSETPDSQSESPPDSFLCSPREDPQYGVTDPYLEAECPTGCSEGEIRSEDSQPESDMGTEYESPLPDPSSSGNSQDDSQWETSPEDSDEATNAPAPVECEPIKCRRIEYDSRPAAMQDLSLYIQLTRKAIDMYHAGDERYNHLTPAEIEKVTTAVDSSYHWLEETRVQFATVDRTINPPVLCSKLKEQKQTSSPTNSVSSSSSNPDPIPEPGTEQDPSSDPEEDPESGPEQDPESGPEEDPEPGPEPVPKQPVITMVYYLPPRKMLEQVVGPILNKPKPVVEPPPPPKKEDESQDGQAQAQGDHMPRPDEATENMDVE